MDKETFLKFQSELSTLYLSLKYKKALKLWKAKKALECCGCKENLANPQGHMSYGGCLSDDLDVLYPAAHR